MAIEADLAGGLPKLSVVGRAVHIMARRAPDSVPIHHALGEIVPLHSILVRGAVRKMRECRLAELVLFELPEILKV